MKISIQCFPSLVVIGIPVVSMDWYDGRNGYVEKNCPCFVILYQTGQAQIMRHQSDEGWFDYYSFNNLICIMKWMLVNMFIMCLYLVNLQIFYFNNYNL